MITTVAALDMRSAVFLAFTENVIFSPAFTSISAYELVVPEVSIVPSTLY